jgi:hypothetical protein
MIDAAAGYVKGGVYEGSVEDGDTVFARLSNGETKL